MESPREFMMERMKLHVETKFEEALRVVCFATMLPEAVHAEYDNQHILYVPVGTNREMHSFDMAVVIENSFHNQTTSLYVLTRSESAS